MPKAGKAKPNNPRVRHWCWTLNNYTPEDVEELEHMPGIRYSVFGREVGEEGTPHLQGYTAFKSAVTIGPLKKINRRIHWEPMYSDPESARNYAIKDGVYTESGVFETRPGKRTDLEEVKSAIDRGATEPEIAEEHFGTWLKYRHGLQAYRMLGMGAREEAPEVFVFYGDTGVGKDYMARKMSPSIYAASHYKWFDGYDGVSDVLFSDYNGQISFERLLVLLDRYGTKVESKGGMIPFRPKRIFITAHYHPKHWYTMLGDRYPELERRLTKLCRFYNSGGTGTEVEVILDSTSETDEPVFINPPDWMDT